jgi:hypothetical protein
MLLHRMAASSGEWDVKALEARLGPEQMDRWEVFNELEPIGLGAILRLLGKIVQHVAIGNQQDLKLDEICPWLQWDD